MAKIYAVANQKGGVGKTTTVGSLGNALAEQEKRVLVVDLDPQAGLTVSLGFDPDAFERTVYQVMLEEEDLKKVVVSTSIPRVDLVPANLDLAGAEADLIGEIGWDRTVKDALGSVLESYDYVFLDCPPSLGVLTTNALVAAQTVLVPLQCEYLALRALKQLQKIVAKVKRKANPDLQIRILRTMFDGPTLHNREMFEEIFRVGGDQVLQAFIKRTIKMADATAAGEPILRYAKNSEAARAYRELAREIGTHG